MNMPDEPVATTGVPRDGLRDSDLPYVEMLVRSTGNFTGEEVDVALEVAGDYLRRGDKSGYSFLRYILDKELSGFCCFGRIPCTVNRFEIYWIVVDRKRQHSGIGSVLLDESEKRIRAMGGVFVYLDTSSKKSYLPARGFYEKNGYVQVATLADFYTDGDDKMIYRKDL